MSDLVERALPIVLTTLGGKMGVKIEIGGQDAFTDGETIHIPALPLHGSPSLRVRAYGYGGHEASHVRNTDMKIFSAFALQGPLAKHLLNIIEDVRIESALIREFPGMGKTFGSLVADIVDQEPEAFAPPRLEDEPEAVLTAWLLISRRHRVLRQGALKRADEEASAVLAGTFPAAFRSNLEALLARLPYLPAGKEATTESVRIAQEILDLIQASAQSQDQDQGQSQGQGQGQGQDKSQGQDQGQGQSQDQGGRQGDALRNLAAKGAGAGGVPDTLATDLGEAIKKSLETLAAESIAPLRSLWLAPPSVCRLTREQEQKARSLAGPMRQSLRILLEDQARVRPRAALSGRRLMPRRLARTALGDGRVFRRVEEARAVKAAMHLLIDASGSMASGVNDSEQAIKAASIAALSIAEAADVLRDVNLAVSAFSSRAACPLVRHGESLSMARQRFGVGAYGGTPLAEAIITVSGQLLAQPEERKVLIILTDGSPDGGPRASRLLIQDLREKSDAIVLGIGLGQAVEDAMEGIFGAGFYRYIDSAEEIRDAIFAMAKSALRQR